MNHKILKLCVNELPIIKQALRRYRYPSDNVFRTAVSSVDAGDAVAMAVKLFFEVLTYVASPGIL